MVPSIHKSIQDNVEPIITKGLTSERDGIYENSNIKIITRRTLAHDSKLQKEFRQKICN